MAEFGNVLAEVPWADGFYVFKLVRYRGGGEVYVDVFAAAGCVADPERALRSAVEEYLRSPEGRQAAEETGWEFNWGDALMYVPVEVFLRHGILPLDVAEVEVHQDEILFSWGYEDENFEDGDRGDD